MIESWDWKKMDGRTGEGEVVILLHSSITLLLQETAIIDLLSMMPLTSFPL